MLKGAKYIFSDDVQVKLLRKSVEHSNNPRLVNPSSLLEAS